MLVAVPAAAGEPASALCPTLASATDAPRLQQIDGAARLAWIDTRLAYTAHRARLWKWGWGIGIGVATLDPAGPVKEPAHLLKAADMALYAAKNAGRNCVRVFSGHAALANPAA